jgi:hypothetical protein
MENKKLWDVDSAMLVLGSSTVDSKTWAEAVEWLMVYGPPEVKKMLLEASSAATEGAFPKLKPTDYTPDGRPIYDVKALAETLNCSEEEVKEILRRKEEEHHLEEIFPDQDGNDTVH